MELRYPSRHHPHPAQYLYGLLSPEIKDKAIEPMTMELEGDSQNEIRTMQHFISEGAWDDDARRVANPLRGTG